VPITDEKAPKDSDFGALIDRLWGVPPGAALVFNCQMGRGRTTTGTVIATLLCLRRRGAFPAHGGGVSAAAAAAAAAASTGPGSTVNGTPAGDGLHHHNHCISSTATADAVAACGGGVGDAGSSDGSVVPAWFLKSGALRGGSGGGGGSAGGLGSPGSLGSPLRNPEAKRRAGMYGVVRSLLRVLERGVEGKAILDAAIDACGAMQVLSCDRSSARRGPLKIT
jgi:Inositol hexakisphosphate